MSRIVDTIVYKGHHFIIETVDDAVHGMCTNISYCNSAGRVTSWKKRIQHTNSMAARLAHNMIVAKPADYIKRV